MWKLEQIAAELSLFRLPQFSCNWNKNLHFCEMTLFSEDNSYTPSDDEALLYDITVKMLLRGRRPFTGYETERRIIATYGAAFSIEERGLEKSAGSIAYSYLPRLTEAYREFADLVSPWGGDPKDVPFDPEHPENERALFEKLFERYGSGIANCLWTQLDLASVLPPESGKNFLGQRADFVLAFPNGAGLVIEPGDHDEAAQIRLDKTRDQVFSNIGFKTLRPRNSEIRGAGLYAEIDNWLDESGSSAYIDSAAHNRSNELLSLNYLLLLPTLAARLERVLVYFLLGRGLIHHKQLTIGVLERDLTCIEIGWLGFVDRLTRLATLYGIHISIPEVAFKVVRNSGYRHESEAAWGLDVEEVGDLDGLKLDLILDVGIKCNPLTAPEIAGATQGAALRQAFPHYKIADFGYRATPAPIAQDEGVEDLLASFVRDFFRKRALRKGQGPILRSVLSQKSTVGLLPTSAGKSLCYQLASLLTPGTTIIVDPLVALMEDQVQTLNDQYGIDRVLSWHAAARLNEKDIGRFLRENIMIFLSPERLQRPGFRSAMRSLNAADIYVNYAVIDEAHCVSMWGHDFRPSYLMLGRNFREQCAFQGREPPVVALTGTASQLVLIDLMRELDIRDPDCVIRPDSFDRPELKFRLMRCRNDEKRNMLGDVLAGIGRRLNVADLSRKAHGIIFTYTPKEAWELFGDQVGDATHYARSVGRAAHDGEMGYGIYTGSPPKASGLDRQEWDDYKRRTLAAFKRGSIKMLFGNTAVSVGIDNEKLNYIVNYRMPQSMEAYYQQCGRAGRSGQQSECVLLFSDDAAHNTDRWLGGELKVMPNRWDDLGSVAFFHQGSFPGIETDTQGALVVLRGLFKDPDEDGSVEVPSYVKPEFTSKEAERTERYLSYWLILGIIADYEVSGMGRNTKYRVQRHPVLLRFMEDKNEALLSDHIVNSLHRYLQRYRPVSREQVARALEQRSEGHLRERCIGYLVEFIYQQIEYQRRASIRTMVEFCREEDTSPERLRTRIKAYFDSSEKFSEPLMQMADEDAEAITVTDLVARVEGFDDAEHLYWETRRLLDERYRPDWVAANLFAIAYRTHGQDSDLFSGNFKALLNALTADNAHHMNRFLASFLPVFVQFNTIFDGNAGTSLLARCVEIIYAEYRLTHGVPIYDMEIPDKVRETLHMQLINLQLKEVLDVRYPRIA